MRRDDHLVGAESAERVLDRLQRVAVADLAARLDPRFPEAAEALLEPLARLLARAVDVELCTPARVVTQVTNGGAIMPAFKGKLTEAQIQAVAKFVSSSAGKK